MRKSSVNYRLTYIPNTSLFGNKDEILCCQKMEPCQNRNPCFLSLQFEMSFNCVLEDEHTCNVINHSYETNRNSQAPSMKPQEPDMNLQVSIKNPQKAARTLKLLARNQQGLA